MLSPYFLLPPYHPPALSCHHSCGLCSLDDASNLELLGCSYGLLGRPPLLLSLSNVSSGQAEQRSKHPLNSPLLLPCPGGVEISPFPERSSLRNYLKICLNKLIFFPPSPPIYTSPYLKGTPPCVGVDTRNLWNVDVKWWNACSWDLANYLPSFLPDPSPRTLGPQGIMQEGKLDGSRDDLVPFSRWGNWFPQIIDLLQITDL